MLYCQSLAMETPPINLQLNESAFFENSPFALQWRHNERGGVSNHWVAIDYSVVCSGSDQRRHQSFASPSILWGEFTGDWWILHTMGGKCFQLMTSSWLSPVVLVTWHTDTLIYPDALIIILVCLRPISILDCARIWYLKIMQRPIGLLPWACVKGLRLSQCVNPVFRRVHPGLCFYVVSLRI